MKKALHKAIHTTAAALLVCFGGSSHAGILSLAEAPLFLTDSIEPNVFFLLDDSGSMEWSVLLQGGGASGLGSGLFAGNYALPVRDNGRDSNWGASNYPYTVNDEQGIPGEGLWRLKFSGFNKLYYNPALTYRPWLGTDSSGTAMFGDSNPEAALVDPTDSTAGTRDLTSDVTIQNYRFDTFSWYWETFYLAKHYTWTDTDGDGVVDANDGFTRVKIEDKNATYSGGHEIGRSDCAAEKYCTYDEEIQNFANWFTYYRKRNYVGRAAIGAVVDDSTAIRSGIHLYNGGLEQSILSLSSTSNKETLLDSLYGIDFRCDNNSCPGTPARNALFQLGQYFKGSSTPLLPSADGGNCQQNFNIIVTDGYWNGAFSSSLIGNADGDDDTAFDGWPYADTASDTLADLAMHYYEKDLDTTIADDVPTNSQDKAKHQHLVTYSVAFGVVGSRDPDGTMTPGDDTDTDPKDAAFTWPTPVANNDTTVDDLWHAAYNGRGEFVSASDPADLKKKLDKVIQNIADRTGSSSSVALSSGFLNSGSLLFQARFDSTRWSGQLLAYSIIDSGPHIGDLGTLEWDAGCVLTGGTCASNGATHTGQDWDTGREILTFKPSTGAGIPFRWPANPGSPTTGELDTVQTDALKNNPITLVADSDAIGEDRLEFIRGREGVSGMRSRSNILGDIVNSNPLLVAAPPFNYPDSMESAPYSTFAGTGTGGMGARTPIIYVGANDGMLHGFVGEVGTSGGEERIAYIPSKVYDNLSDLTSPEYGGTIGHRSFVDSSPAAGDVFWGGSWKTVLVGALGRGGQGLFALDVTNPSNFDENKASSVVLWEFTDDNDADLGYTYGQPSVVRLHNGVWAAVFGNGYNNTRTDGSVSTTGNAVLYIVNIATGALIKKLDTGKGTADDPLAAARPNGLASPSPVDLDGDRIVDLIYAPDLFGNVWKIDVSNASPANWDFSSRSGSSPVPLFVARNASGTAQPITAKVDVGLHPSQPGQMIYLGTGKYIENGDNSPVSQPTQVFFGVWDRNESSPSTITRAHLQQQSILEEQNYGSDVILRRTSTNTFAWHTSSGLPGTGSSAGKLGWYMDLYNTQGGATDNKGERVVADPVLRDSKIVFVTLLPEDDPCTSGGKSFLMELEAATGMRLETPPFDLNGDGLFNDSDKGTAASGLWSPGGISSGVGIMPSPGILKDNTYNDQGLGREFKYFSGSKGAVQKVSESRGGASFGRQSWREIFPK